MKGRMRFFKRYVEDQQFLGCLWMSVACYQKFGEDRDFLYKEGVS